MQAATMSCIGAVGFLNVGTMLALHGVGTPAGLALSLSAVCGLLMLQGFTRIDRLDKFEKDMRG